MSYTLKTQQIAVKDPETGTYSGVDVLTEQTKSGLLAEIQAEGAAQRTSVTNTGTTQVTAIQTKGAETLASIPPDYTTLSNDVDDLKNTLNGINVIGKIRMSQTINKYVDGVTHVIANGSGDILITTVDILFTDHRIQLDCPDGYQYLVFYYSTNVWATENYINNSGWRTGKYVIDKNKYFAIQFRRENSVAFASEADKNILTVDETIRNQEETASVKAELEYDASVFDKQLSILSFRDSQKINKAINGITFLLDDTSGDNTITTNILHYANHNIVANCPTGYKYVVAMYSTVTYSTAGHIANSAWITGEYTIPKGVYFAIQFRRSDNSAFTNGEADKMIFELDRFVNFDIYDYINEITGIVPFRDCQQINKVVNGVSFLLEDATGNTTITNNQILYAKENITLDCPSDCKYVVHYFKSAEWTTANHTISSAWITGKYIVKKGSYYVVQFKKLDNSAFANGEADKTLLTYMDVAVEDQTLYHIIVTGQSLGVGAEGNPALTTVTPYEYIGGAYQFNGGSRPIDGMVNDTGVEEIAILDSCLESFSSLREQTHMLTLGSGEDVRHGYQGETIDSAMGYWFTKLTGKKVLVSNHAFGGKSYVQLKKGTTAYNNSIRAVYHAKELCDRIGWKYVVYAIAVVHGEADSEAGMTASQYKNCLREWQLNYDEDIKAITGQVETVQLFASQTVSASSYGLEYAKVANGVFLANNQYKEIHVVCPQYAYPLTYASVHMNNYGYRYLGEFFGYIMGRIFNGNLNTVLFPIKSELSSNKITITFNNVPSLMSLAYDGFNIAPVSDGHWGFELVDDENSVAITDVSIVSNKIEITLSGAPSEDAQISYAYKVLSDEVGKIGSSQGLRGNIRSNWGIPSIFTNTVLTNNCVVFCVPVNWSAS